MMPLLEISFDSFFPLCADGRAAGCFPHPGDCLADNVVVDRHALCVILKPHSPVGRDAEAGSFLHGVHVGTEEQELPAVLLFFPLDHPADLLIAKPFAGVFQPVGGILLQPAHGTAAVQNENKLGKIFLHNNALRFVVYRFRWQKDTTNRRAKGQRAGDKLRTQLFLIVFNHQLFTESTEEEMLISMAEPASDKADAILDRLDLLQFKERHPMALSGGQKQRVAIATALVSERKVLVLDEPTSGLDLQHMKEVADELITIQEMGKTSLVITHDYELIVSCCTHVLHLEHGVVQEQYALDATGFQLLKNFFIESR